MRQVGLNLDTESIEQGDRPAGLEAQAGGIAAPRNDDERNQNPGGDQQGEAEQAESAQR
jgi:hypothetical protein